jgi:hypothetical protein
MPSARILLVDLETSPLLGWAYKVWDANIIRVEREPYIFCFSYKWLGEKSIQVVAQPDFVSEYLANPYDDKLVVKELWRVFDEADIVIAHNLKGFDEKVSFERFLHHKLGPPSPYKCVDTLLVARRYFKNSSNSLDNLCKKLGIDGHHGSWVAMKKYNVRDIKMLEGLYLTLRPYMSNHPNINMYTEDDGCPKCGSKKVQYRGSSVSNVASYRRVQCQDCGAWSRERIADKEARKPGVV